MANSPTNIVEFRGFDSSIILILRGGILRPIRDFPESLSQAMLVGVMLVGRLGVFYLFDISKSSRTRELFDVSPSKSDDSEALWRETLAIFKYGDLFMISPTIISNKTY